MFVGTLICIFVLCSLQRTRCLLLIYSVHVRRPKPKSPVKQKTPKKEGDDDEDDNWEVPDGDIPYC